MEDLRVLGFATGPEGVSGALHEAVLGVNRVSAQSVRYLDLNQLVPSRQSSLLSAVHEDHASAVVVLTLGLPFDDQAEAFCEAVRAQWKGTAKEIIFYFNDAPLAAQDSARLAQATKLARLREQVDARGFRSPEELVLRLTVDLKRTTGTPVAPPSLDFTPYLSVLSRTHSHVDLPALHSEATHRLFLDRVYATFRTRPEARGAVAPAHEVRGALTPKDILSNSQPWAIVGPSGSGKTTFLHYLATRLAREHLDTPTGFAEEMGMDITPIPVLIDLGLVADILNSEPDHRDTLDRWCSVLAAVLGRGGVIAQTKDLRARLERGQLLWMFDGLDAIASASSRAQVARAIANLVQTYAGHRYLLTCRSGTWAEQSILSAFTEARMESLGSDDIIDFINRRHGVLGASNVEASPQNLKDRLRSNRALRQLASRPQTLMMLSTVYSPDRRLPESPAHLYETYISVLLGARQTALEPFGGPPTAWRVLSKLAVRMQEGRRESGQPKNQLDRVDVLEIVKSRYPSPDPKPADVEGLLSVLLSLPGLVQDVAGAVTFHHRSLQEYLVARTLADRRDPVSPMSAAIDAPWWRNVVTRTLGVLAQQGDTRVREFFEALLRTTGPLDQNPARLEVLTAALDDLQSQRLPSYALSPVTKALDSLRSFLEEPEQVASERLRIQIAEGLSRLGDPRLTETDRWIDIPPGRYWRGAAPDDNRAFHSEKPAGWITLTYGYRIQRWPVTVLEMARFVEVGGYRTQKWWPRAGWAWRKAQGIDTPAHWDAQQARLNHPVTGVSWWEAEAYCAWLSSVASDLEPNEKVRLPTEAEWERAARGGERHATGATNLHPYRIYPWGSTYEADRCNAENRHWGTTPVGCYPAGHSPEGLWDMAGNVWEWCLDRFDERSLWRPPPYSSANGRDPRVYRHGRTVAVRGGSWALGAEWLRVSASFLRLPTHRFVNRGFRPVRSVRSPFHA